MEVGAKLRSVLDNLLSNFYDVIIIVYRYNMPSYIETLLGHHR